MDISEGGGNVPTKCLFFRPTPHVAFAPPAPLRPLKYLLRAVFNDGPLNLSRKSGSFLHPEQLVNEQTYEKKFDMKDTLLAALYIFAIEKIFEMTFVIEL